MSEADQLHQFLEALFPEGLIEIRLIEDVKRTKTYTPVVVQRAWYDGAAALETALPELMRVAAARRAAIFFGVLPRARQGGKLVDLWSDANTLWADVDFKDIAEDEARALLDQFPLPPSIIVKSGHGLHLYWLLAKTMPPAALSILSQRLATVLHADTCSDAARILRLPTTYNRKSEWENPPSPPTLVEFEYLDVERRYTMAEVAAALPSELTPTKPTETASTKLIIGEAVSDRVKLLLEEDSRLRDLRDGKGKTEGDCSRSGYDASFLAALARHGIDDADELGTALWHTRPKCQEKGEANVARTVRFALKVAAEAQEQKEGDNADELTDLGNAEHLARELNGDARYCPTTKQWLLWDRQRFVFDSDGEIYRRAKEAILKLRRTAKSDAQRKHVIRSQQRAGI